jgi:cysteine desulfurase/selenocysteine lyase
MSDEASTKYEFRDCIPQNTAMRFMHGNINFAGFFGMKAALKLLTEIGFEKIEKRLIGLADRLVDSLQDHGFDFLSPLERKHRSHILTVSVKDPDRVVSYMRERKVIICKRVGGIRVSPSFYNTEEELDNFVSLMSRFS